MKLSDSLEKTQIAINESTWFSWTQITINWPLISTYYFVWQFMIICETFVAIYVAIVQKGVALCKISRAFTTDLVCVYGYVLCDLRYHIYYQIITTK